MGFVMGFVMEGPIRIMELRGTYKGGGGPDKTILNSAARHSKHDFFVLVTYLKDPEDHEFQITEMAKERGLENYVELEDRRMFDFKCLFELYKLVKRHDIHIIHVHDQKTALLGVLLKLMCSKVHIMNTAHGWIANSHHAKIKQIIHFLILKIYPLHIAVSEATRRVMIKNGIKAETITTLYNAIDTDYWKKSETPATLRDEYHIPEDYKIVGTVGRLSEEKDISTFLAVAAKVLEVDPKVKFVIVGDSKHPSLVDALKRRAEELRISNSVVFTGHRTDLLNVYDSFDIFLSTSLTEGLPNTLLESMAMGVPIVATDVGGVPELIQHAVNGFLCKPGEIDTLLNSVLDMVNNPQKCEKLAANGTDYIEQNFSFKSRLDSIEKIYRNFYFATI